MRSTAINRPAIGCERPSFWREAISWQGAATWRVLPHVGIFGALSTAVYLADYFYPQFLLPVGFYKLAGAVLGILIVVRTNAGYERW